MKQGRRSGTAVYERGQTYGRSHAVHTKRIKQAINHARIQKHYLCPDSQVPPPHGPHPTTAGAGNRGEIARTHTYVCMYVRV